MYAHELGNNIVFRKLVVRLLSGEYFLFEGVMKTNLKELQLFLTYLDHSVPSPSCLRKGFIEIRSWCSNTFSHNLLKTVIMADAEFSLMSLFFLLN